MFAVYETWRDFLCVLLTLLFRVRKEAIIIFLCKMNINDKTNKRRDDEGVFQSVVWDMNHGWDVISSSLRHRQWSCSCSIFFFFKGWSDDRENRMLFFRHSLQSSSSSRLQWLFDRIAIKVRMWLFLLYSSLSLSFRLNNLSLLLPSKWNTVDDDKKVRRWKRAEVQGRWRSWLNTIQSKTDFSRNIMKSGMRMSMKTTGIFVQSAWLLK